MTPGPGIEPGPHWWEASALTTAPSLNRINVPFRICDAIKSFGSVVFGLIDENNDFNNAHNLCCECCKHCITYFEKNVAKIDAKLKKFQSRALKPPKRICRKKKKKGKLFTVA